MFHQEPGSLGLEWGTGRQREAVLVGTLHGYFSRKVWVEFKEMFLGRSDKQKMGGKGFALRIY